MNERTNKQTNKQPIQNKRIETKRTKKQSKEMSSILLIIEVNFHAQRKKGKERKKCILLSMLSKVLRFLYADIDLYFVVNGLIQYKSEIS
jgi:hypothetical protein